MSTLLALDPALGVSAREFAAAWNADPRTDDLATADVRTAGLAEAGPPEVHEHVVLETAAAASMAVSASALSDLIRDILQQGGVSGLVRLAEQEAANGDVLVHATVEKE
jgi:hypothetical protein